MVKNPYPEKIIDEVSGCEVPNERHQIWQEGYGAGSNKAMVVMTSKGLDDFRAGKEEGRVINHVYRFQDDMVAVFDEKGEHLPEFQGRYEDVRVKILARAPAGAKFIRGDWPAVENPVPRKDW